MFNYSVFVFIGGWVLWFFIDKHASAPGMPVPETLDTMLENFQLCFDILKAGYMKAAYVFIWKAHYLVLSVIGGLLLSILFEQVSGMLRRRHLRHLMWPQKNVQGTQQATEGQLAPPSLTSARTDVEKH